MTIRTQLLLGFFVLIAVFVVDFFVNQRLSKQVLTNTTYLNNSESVIRNSNILHKEMIGMQSGFRGFLLTSQEVFLQPYYSGIKSVPDILSQQKNLVSSKDQLMRLDSINIIHALWIEYADSLIYTKRDTIPGSSKSYERLFNEKFRTEVGKKLNDKISSMFISFDKYEYDLRQNRRLILQNSIKRTRDISIFLTVASIILALLSSFYFIGNITSRIGKMVNLSERISNGDFIVIEDKKRDEFHSLVESLNDMSTTLDKNFKDLQKKNSELDQFAYVVSHDLKAPLRGISNIILWIEEDHQHDLTTDVIRNLELIKGRTERLENMINGLLDYARIGRVKMKLAEININELIHEIREMLVPEKFEFIVKGQLPIIKAEKLRVEQIFSNLISNAVKYNNKTNPQIIIEYKNQEEYHEFFVSDNGPGIEAEYFEKIFIIFQTLQERDAFESTGVGLAIVKRIIEENKGTIKVESSIGKGTTFVFTWPKQFIIT